MEAKEIKTQLYWPTAIVLRLTHRLLGQRTICEGMENIPRRGGGVLASKHQSNGDPPTLTRLLGRMIYFMAKAELYRSRFGQLYFSHAATFPVDRNKLKSVVRALMLAKELVRADKIVGIFPEGTRTPGLKLGPLHGGAMKVALEAGAPIIPIGLLYDDNKNAS